VVTLRETQTRATSCRNRVGAPPAPALEVDSRERQVVGVRTVPVTRAFKFRFYPTDSRAAEPARTFGCVRKVYNLALAARSEAWAMRQERVNYHTTSAMLTATNRPLNIVWSRRLPDGVLPSTVTVSHLLALSTGEKSTNPRNERRDRDRLARAQRCLARKAAGDGANRAKARRGVARAHARIADRRNDHLHKITTRLVRENQTLVIEDLAVRNMVRNRHLARAISDAGWRRFREQLEHKAAWYGREVITVDRSPSSKLCSACGTRRTRLPLATRVWTCTCGATHDRDVNAARNIKAAGLAASACGAGARPQRKHSGRAIGDESGIPCDQGRGQPLTAPAVSPCTRNRCTTAKTSTTGTAATTPPAASAPKSVLNSPSA
jgi:putative transposase